MRFKVCVILALVFLFCAPLIYRANSEYAKSLLAVQQSDDRRLILENLAKALTWSLPFTSQADLINSKFEEMLKQDGLSAQDKITTLLEWRRGLFSARKFWGLWSNNTLIVEEVDAALAELYKANNQTAALVDLNKATPQLKMQPLIQLLFIVWLTSTFLLIWNCFDSRAQVNWRKLVSYAPFVLVAYAAWLYCLAF